MSDSQVVKDIQNVVWRACDTFRGAIDPSDYKNYILTMLFLKYLSDVWADRKAEYEKRYKGNVERVRRALERERFVVPEISLKNESGKVSDTFPATFDSLYARRDADNIGELINMVLAEIEDSNKGKLENVFRDIDFNSEANLGDARERNRRLKHLLEDFNNPKLDLRPSRLPDRDIIGDVYEYLIGNFAANAGKKAGEFYTPSAVSTLLARLLAPRAGDRICDPACGSGSLLLKVGREVPPENDQQNYALFGQEANAATWALCKMNMFLHETDSARIERCNTLTDPKLLEDDRLMKFEVVVANPPFSLDKWGAELAAADRFERYRRGIPPKSKADYAFILHMLHIAQADTGKVGVIVPHGVLFRGGSEGKIRQALIEENLLDAVIGLPTNLFFGTGIPTAILLFNKGRKTKDVLFIDASRDYQDSKNQNVLREEDIARIVKTYRAYKSVEKYAYRATPEELRENDFNLNIPRYVDTFEEEEEIDIAAVQREIDDLEAQLAKTRKEMAKHLKELGLI